MKEKHISQLAALMITVFATGQTQEETIKRSVTLYNPYKPTLAGGDQESTSACGR